MKIKEEPIDLEYERVISNTSNICTLQSPIDVSCVKLDSSIDGIDDPNHLLLNGALNGVLQSTNDHVEPQIPMPVSALPVIKTPIPTAGANLSSSLPAFENWPGDYQFTLSFRPQQKSTKGVSWTYSKIKDKLYVGKDVPCPINFSTNTLLPNDVYIRALALYTSPEQVSERVERCINHSKEEIQNGLVEAQHLIRCESPTAVYQSDKMTGRHSVLVPYENSPAGQEYSTYIYKFACFTSCPGGPNRRPLMLIFTLEKGNQVIGRRKLDVKICACPGRDRKTDEASHLESEIPNQSIALPLKRKLNTDFVNLSSCMDFTKHVYVPSPKKFYPNKDGSYVLNIKDKGCYNFLKQMEKLYEMCQSVKGLTPEAFSAACNGILSKKQRTEKND